MSIVTTVQFRGVDASPALEAAILEHAGRLPKFAADVRQCRVVVSKDSNRHRHGSAYRVGIHVTLDGQIIDAGDEGTPAAGHTDPYVAVTDAFNAVRRRIEDHARVRRGDVKRKQKA